MAQTTQNSDTIEISDDESDLYQEWDKKKPRLTPTPTRKNQDPRL